MVDKVVEVVSQNFEEKYLPRLIRYMRQPSVSATGEGIDEMTRILKEDIEELGGEGAVVEANEFPIVYGKFDVGAPRTLIVHTQYDVALTGEPEWVVDPFSATRMEWRDFGECILGRGAEDTKSQVSLIYNTIEAYRDAGVPLPVNVILVQEASELGSGSLPGFVHDHLDELKQADVAWWPFVTGLPNRKAVVHLGAKGLITGKMRCAGGDWGGPVESEVHSSNANLVANPAMELVKALKSIKSDDDRDILIPDFYSDVERPSEEDAELIDNLAKRVDQQGLLNSFGGAKRFKQDDIREALYDYCFKSEFNISGLRAGEVIEGGHKAIVPREAIASIDLRPIGQDADRLIGCIESYLESSYPAVKWETQNQYEGDRMPVSNWAAQELIQVYSDMGIDPEVWPTTAMAIANKLWTRTVGIPWLMGAPAHAAGKHAANEYIIVDSYRDACEFGVRLLHRLASSAQAQR
jgi:acetylornithine deacetylase/succinyl-diaminopimelate desuccinylase-like protein